MTTINWDRSLRYRPYQNWPEDYLMTLKAKVNQSTWRTQTHIQPPSGLLNDPCAFNWYNGQWHLFYQAFPFGPVHGLKSWQHLVSADLMHWQQAQGALLPDTVYDAQGVYTGSGLADGDQLKLMYTGNVRDADWQRQSYQMGARLDANGQVEKTPQPLIKEPPTGCTSEFRDPFLFRRQGSVYCLVGGQTQNKNGQIFLYQKQAGSWQYRGPLHLPQALLGYMVECPNIAWIDGHVVLMYCPQGLSQTELAYQNQYPNIALIADDLNLETLELTGELHVQQVDLGFDFYAARLTQTPAGQTLMLGWAGLPDATYPSDQDGWANCLSYVRTLHVKDGRLVSQPAALDQLKQAPIQPRCSKADTRFDAAMPLSVELCLPEKQDLTIRVSGLEMHWQAGSRVVEWLRLSDHARRAVTLSKEADLQMILYLDCSIFECYLAEGTAVFTGRFFPRKGAQSSVTITGLTAKAKAECWRLEAVNALQDKR